MTALLHLILFTVAYAQTQPSKSNECVESCLKSDPTLLSHGNNFGIFENITRNIDNYCRNYQQIIQCSEACSDEGRTELRQKLLLDEYICIEKVEEFRVAKDCVQSQEVDSINQCLKACAYPTDSTLQLEIPDLSDDVNPPEYINALSPRCRSLECTLRCSVGKMNQKCAGSGELLKEVGKKQIMKTRQRLQATRNETFPSDESTQGQVKNIPEQCAFLMDPDKFDNLFTEEEWGAEMPTEVATVEEVVTTTPEDRNGYTKFKPVFGELEENTSTKIVEIAIEPDTVAPSTSNDDNLSSFTTNPEVVKTTVASVPELPDLEAGGRDNIPLTNDENQHQDSVSGKGEGFENVNEKLDDSQKNINESRKDANNSTEKTIHIADDEVEKGKNGIENFVRPISAARRQSLSLFLLFTMVCVLASLRV